REPRGDAVGANRRAIDHDSRGETLMLGLAEPIVTMSEAQAYVRIETGEEEALLAGLIRTASGLCEAFINQAIISRSFECDLPGCAASRRAFVHGARWRRRRAASGGDRAVAPLPPDETFLMAAPIHTNRRRR